MYNHRWFYLIRPSIKYATQTRRNNAKTQPSEFDMIKISKESSKAWKELPANEKKYWDSISQKEKEEYEKKLGEFDGSLQVRTDVLKKKVCLIGF